jgi:hypothetical protein
MTALDAIWHVLNAMAAPLGLALSWAVLTGWGSVAALTAHIGTWAYLDVEGTMLGYALMVLACAMALWFRVFVLPARPE